MLYYRSLLINTNKEFMIDSSQNVSKSDHTLAKQILFVDICNIYTMVIYKS